MLETLKFIRTEGLTALCERFHITVKRHGVYPNLVQLKYSQIDSPMGERIVQECRGLILDEADDWRVVAFPYTKFFNHGEGHAAPIDWSTAKVYEKLDGSLMTLYYYRDKWHVASSGLPDAGGPVCGAYPGTFADLFWQTWNALGYQLPVPMTDTPFETCFMFELMTPYNRIVCKQGASRIVLHGVRVCEPDYEECPPEAWAPKFGWECVRTFPLGTFDDCLASVQTIDPMDGEGYVVCDAVFNRVKVKSPQYVALAHLKDGFSLRRLLEIVRANESSEFLAHFPEWTDAYDKVRTAFDALCGEVESAFAALRYIPERKAFALKATQTRCPSALFALKDGKAASARDFFANCTTQALERVIGIDLGEDVVPNELERSDR